ncbi:hypothetical protein, partial [Burkholderia pseudomallei]
PPIRRQRRVPPSIVAHKTARPSKTDIRMSKCDRRARRGRFCRAERIRRRIRRRIRARRAGRRGRVGMGIGAACREAMR